MTKVHREAVKFASEGYTIVLIGHAGHEEVEGTMGEAPEHIVLVETEADVDALEVPDPERIAYISQTTLSVDETRAIIDRLREKFPSITGPRTDDICYATTNRQLAVKQMAAECDLVLVIGSQNSSNSQRLVDVARDYGADAHLIDNEAQVRDEWLEGARVVGISSGASAPEELVQRLVEFFRARGTEDVSEFEVLREDVRFMLPKTIRQALAAIRARVSRVGATDRRSAASRSQARISSPCSSSAGGGRRIGGRSPSTRSGGRQGRPSCPRSAPCRARSASANASSTPLMGPAGTTRAREQLDPVRGGLAAEHRRRRSASSSACSTRAELVAKRSSSARLAEPERLAQAREQAVVADRDGERAVGGLEGLVGRDARVAVAAPVRRHAAEHPRRALVEQRGQRRVHQRDLDVAPAPGPRALDSAAWMPVTASSPHTRSTTAAPTFSGGPSASPVTCISPPIACSRKS